MAMPSPRLPVLRISLRAMCPRMTAGMALSPPVKSSRMPQTIDPVASPLVVVMAGRYGG